MNPTFFGKAGKSKVQIVEYVNKKGEHFQFSVKRDDLIHPLVSGNKWRKLKFNVQYAVDEGYTGIASFGGAFSNHIAALAAAGRAVAMPTLGLIRSHEIDEQNPTLRRARGMGMRLINLSRDDYRRRHDTEFLAQLQQQFSDYFFVPEGGSNHLAEPGLAELAEEIREAGNFDVIACAIGSGGTISGLMNAMPRQRFIGVAAVNDAQLLTQLESQAHGRLQVHLASLFGGYGRLTPELETFCLDFFAQTQIPIEPVYTGKLFYALCHHRAELGISNNTRVLALHTGGLQGLHGLIYRRQIDPERWQPIIATLPV